MIMSYQVSSGNCGIVTVLFVLQVTVTYLTQRKNKILQNTTLATFLKAVVRGEPPMKLAAILYRDNTYQPIINTLVCKRLSRECTALCSDKQPSVLRKTSADDLQTIDWNVIVSEWQDRAKLLYSVLESVAFKTHMQHRKSTRTDEQTLKRHLPGIVQAGCALLFHRNPKMCRLQTAVGLVLDKGGTTDEVCFA